MMKPDDFEKLGVFYLGRELDPASGDLAEMPLLYDSRDLTTHAVCVGMTGSGKTGLGIALLEEAAIDGIPALIIDPKGDMGNLALNFPALSPADFRPWIDPQAAARQGIDVDTLADRTAELWRKGLAEWGQGPQRLQLLRDAAEVKIYTPGSDAGEPISVLRSFDPPEAEIINDASALRDHTNSTVGGLLGLLGITADPLRSREHILLASLLDHAWRQGRSLNLPELIAGIQKPPFQQVGVFDIESFYPAAQRLDLAMALNNLLAAPGFDIWLRGSPLDIQRLLFTTDGRPRLAVLTLAHLSDSERMFFVTLLLNAVISWMRRQPGTSSLRALLYMDEIFGYFPPHRHAGLQTADVNPPQTGAGLWLGRRAGHPKSR